MATKNVGCSEYNHLTRRSFLRSSALMGGAAITAPAWLPKVALASSYGSNRDTLVSIYLRGGIDGMTMCCPFADDRYYELRPQTGVPRPDSSLPRKAIDLDGFFGFAPGMSGLLEAYTSGNLAVVHACGVNGWTRSHFDAQRYMEIASPFDSSLVTGWLGRHLAQTPSADPNSIIRGMSLTYGMVRTMSGAPLSLAVPYPENYGLGGDWPNEAELRQWLDVAYDRQDDPMKSAAENTQQTIDLLEQINFEQYVPAGGAVYPETEFGRALKSTAALIKSDIGVEAIHIDKDGWDTHANQGSVGGQMDELMTDLADALGAFHKDMFSSNRSDFSLVALSEFGRTAQQNNSQGTDHGTATAVLVMGGSVIGNRVIRNWPGLAPEQLYEGVDLAPTIDFRDVVGEILAKRCGNTNLSGIFPGYTPQFRGIFA